MIIFCDKNTGNPIGAVFGRVHSDTDLKIKIGDPNNTIKIVINWKMYRYYDQNGKEISKEQADKLLKEKKIINADFIPDHSQRKLLELFDRKPSEVYNYRYNQQTSLFERK